MSRSIVVRWFFGSLIGLAGGLVLLVVAGAVALANDVFIMRGPDVVGIRSGALSWTLAGLVALALLVMMAAAVAVFVAWIGAVLNTASLPSKMNRPGFRASSVMCERPVGRHGSSHSSRLRPQRVGVGRGGASAGSSCTSSPSRR